MKINNVLFVIVGICIGVSCTVTPFELIRKFNARSYRPCQDFQTKQPTGKLCYRYCKKYKVFRKGDSKKCKIWMSDVVDFSNPEVFKRFRDSGFIMLQESRVR